MISVNDISLNAALVEMGMSSGTTKEIGALCGQLNTYSTNAYHSADSWRNLSGFSGANIWHFLYAGPAVDQYNGYIRVTITNYAQIDAQSGTMDWYLRDGSYNYGGSGSQSVASLGTNAQRTYDLPWATYQPTIFGYRWSNSLQYTEFSIT